MSLIMQSVSTPSHRQYYELETLTAQIISPLMTARGVYYDGKVTPMVSGDKPLARKTKSSGDDNFNIKTPNMFFSEKYCS